MLLCSPIPWLEQHFNLVAYATVAVMVLVAILAACVVEWWTERE